MLEYHEILGSEKPIYVKKGKLLTFDEIDTVEGYKIAGFLEIRVGDKTLYNPLYKKEGN